MKFRFINMKMASAYTKFVQYYNEKELFNKIKKLSGRLGTGVLYHVFVLFYLISDKKISYRKRLIIIAALGYFILPTDLVADFIPILGFTDDVSFLVFAIATVNNHITDEISAKARKAVEKITGKKVTQKDKMSESLTKE